MSIIVCSPLPHKGRPPRCQFHQWRLCIWEPRRLNQTDSLGSQMRLYNGGACIWHTISLHIIGWNEWGSVQWYISYCLNFMWSSAVLEWYLSFLVDTSWMNSMWRGILTRAVNDVLGTQVPQLTSCNSCGALYRTDCRERVAPCPTLTLRQM